MGVHESIAKATLKGELRKSKANFEETLKAAENFHKRRKKKLSKVDAEYYLDNSKNIYDGAIIESYKIQRRNSWHFKSQIYFITPNVYPIKDFGRAAYFAVEQFDSRHFLNGKRNYSDILGSKLMLCEHFLLRSMQRLNLATFGDIGKMISPIINWVVNERIPLKHLPQNPMFVMKDFVLICKKLDNSEGLIFKTIIMRNVMSTKQLKEYESAFTCIDNEIAKCAMVNELGVVLRKINHTSSSLHFNDFCTESPWLFSLRDSMKQNQQHQTH
jgi:hypothetical protein